MSTGRELSIIIPSYNEQDNIQRTFQTIDEILTQNHIPYEIIFVDDGSKDLTFTRIQELSLQSGQVKGISFSRNFGKEAAIFAGLESAGGACCLIMDCDLQHPPSLFLKCTISGRKAMRWWKVSRLPVERKISSILSAQIPFTV